MSLTWEPSDGLPSQWYREETILGDFLRAIRELDDNQSLNLESYFSEHRGAGVLAASVQLSDPAARSRVLREATMLGVDLLRNDDGPPDSILDAR